jgi:hypothetical protein
MTAVAYIAVPPRPPVDYLTVWYRWLNSYTADEGLTVRRVYVDGPGSGGQEFERMTNTLADGAADTVVVPCLDHLARYRPGSGWAIAQALLTQLGTRVREVEPAGDPR